MSELSGRGFARDELVICTKGGYLPFDGAPPRDALTTRLPELLRRAASRVRRTPGGATHVAESTAAGLALGGCLIRALFLAVFLLFAFVTMSVLVGGSLLQIFGVYYW